MMNALMISARVAIILLGVGICASAILGIVDPELGASNLPTPPSRSESVVYGVIMLVYAAVLFIPPNFLRAPALFYPALIIRGLAFARIAFVSAAIIWQQAISATTLLFLLLIPGALLCMPSGLSVYELLYARYGATPPNQSLEPTAGRCTEKVEG
jgi:hypothetical protein